MYFMNSVLSNHLDTLSGVVVASPRPPSAVF